MKKSMLLVVVAVITMFVLSACGAKAQLKKETGFSWKDAVEYVKGGSGPADPSEDFGDLTAVSHGDRLIVDNEKLDPRACFSEIDDETWAKVIAWADQWGEDSPTRIEWQVNESRCSWVLPGNITDQITEQDYEEVLQILASAGYTDTWFVSGSEGQEFGRKTYSEIISASSTINRVHIFGTKLTVMPTRIQ